MSQPTLFELSAPVRPACHYCGGALAELDALLPHTCEMSLVCVGCCQACHSAALDRIFTDMRRTRTTDALPRYEGRGAR